MSHIIVLFLSPFLTALNLIRACVFWIPNRMVPKTNMTTNEVPIGTFVIETKTLQQQERDCRIVKVMCQPH